MTQNVKTIISTNKLVKEYVTGGYKTIALNEVSIDVFENEYVAIMGASGSGKTTLLSILGCLDTPTSGEYKLDNKFVNEMDFTLLAKIRNQKIGFVFQSFCLLSNYSALKNVQLPLIYGGVSEPEQRERAQKALELVHLKKRIHHMPDQLSGGEKQRVAIARALVNNPSVILADEPTGNLDAVTKKEIMAILKELHNRRNTIILVTHDENVAKESSRIIHLDNGYVFSDRKN